jgi:hypothetical protein
VQINQRETGYLTLVKYDETEVVYMERIFLKVDVDGCCLFF